MMILVAIAVLIAVVVLFLAARALAVYASVRRYRKFWRRQAELPTRANEFCLVAIGDSSMQAIGATRPRRGVVGRAAAYIATQTGRPVRIINISQTGGKIGNVVADQLSVLANAKADLVIVAVGANDAITQTDIASFEHDYRTMAAKLPRGKTVLGGMPYVKHRDQYAAVLQKVSSEYGLPVVPIFETMMPYEHDYTTYGGDFFHPSSKGYGLWFSAYLPEIKKILGAPVFENNR